MDIPITTFWFMNSNINRVRAEAEMRTLDVLAYVQTNEGQVKYREHLKIEMGEIATESKIISTERDESGLLELKLLAAQL